MLASAARHLMNVGGARSDAPPSHSSTSQASVARPPKDSKMSPLICHRCDVMTFGIRKDTPIHRRPTRHHHYPATVDGGHRQHCH